MACKKFQCWEIFDVIPVNKNLGYFYLYLPKSLLSSQDISPAKFNLLIMPCITCYSSPVSYNRWELTILRKYFTSLDLVNMGPGNSP